MMQSLAGSAQLSFHADCDISALMAKRQAWKAEGRRVSLEDCLVAALADTMAEYPEFNGSVEGDVLALQDGVDVSVAISVSGLLLTPVVRDADRLPLDQIAAKRSDLVGRAGSGQLKTSEIVGGTTTISNLGRTVVRFFTPILNKGQLTILGIGRVADRLVLGPKGEIETRSEIGLSLTVDHRFIDGDPAARILASICSTLNDFPDDR